MISYNWANKKIVTKIAAALKERGYRIWIDDEQMRGSILEASMLFSFSFGQLLTIYCSGRCDRTICSCVDVLLPKI